MDFVKDFGPEFVVSRKRVCSNFLRVRPYLVRLNIVDQANAAGPIVYFFRVIVIDAGSTYRGHYHGFLVLYLDLIGRSRCR